MKNFLLVTALCCLAPVMIQAQENTSGSWVYMTAEDFVNDNRRSVGEYAIARAKGEGQYKDSLKLVYAAARIDGDKKSDVSKEAWGMVSGGQLYVRNKVLNDGKGYSKSFSPGRYNLFFAVVKESGEARRKYSYAKDDVRFYGKEEGKDRGTLNVGGIGISMGSSTVIFIPIVIDRKTGEMRAYSQAYMQELGGRHPGIAPVSMNEAHGSRLIKYFRELNVHE